MPSSQLALDFSAAAAEPEVRAEIAPSPPTPPAMEPPGGPESQPPPQEAVSARHGDRRDPRTIAWDLYTQKLRRDSAPHRHDGWSNPVTEELYILLVNDSRHHRAIGAMVDRTNRHLDPQRLAEYVLREQRMAMARGLDDLKLHWLVETQDPQSLANQIDWEQIAEEWPKPERLSEPEPLKAADKAEAPTIRRAEPLRLAGGTIPREVLAVLSGCTVTGTQVKINSGRLEPRLYKAVNQILSQLGGVWNTSAQAHIFEEDPSDQFDRVLLTGVLAPPEKFGFFPTPAELADELAAWIGFEDGHQVLEPEGGIGNLALAVQRIAPAARIHCYELQPKNVATLQSLGFTVETADFLEVAPQPVYDRIIMNPPFERQADIEHVRHALKFLKPGGVLGAIMGASLLFRDNTRTQVFRELLQRSGNELRENAPGAFKSSGTAVHTVSVRITNF